MSKAVKTYEDELARCRDLGIAGGHTLKKIRRGLVELPTYGVPRHLLGGVSYLLDHHEVEEVRRSISWILVAVAKEYDHIRVAREEDR